MKKELMLEHLQNKEAMKFIDRVCNTLFRCTTKCVIDYHAGGFFVKKEILYLLFIERGKAMIYNREEGGSPLDSNNDLLLEIIRTDGTNFEVEQMNDMVNILKLSNSIQEFFCMPSIFLENIESKHLTEVILDSKKETSINVLSVHMKLNNDN